MALHLCLLIGQFVVLHFETACGKRNDQLEQFLFYHCLHTQNEQINTFFIGVHFKAK